jgi:putative oxidoreductase
MQIQLEDNPQALSVTSAQTLLRLVAGGAGLLHGTQKLLNPGPFTAELAKLAVPSPELVVTAVFALELGAGALLVLGWLTRMSAFVLYCDAMLSVALLYLEQRLATSLLPLEAAVLQGATCLFFLVVGSGPFGADYALKRRARLRAIAKDELWKRPPYVA